MKSDAFLTTQWTAVLAASGSSETARQALSALCETYYAPVVSFLQRDGRKEDDAREMAHGFFQWLLEKDRFACLERERARFRSYLLGALKNYQRHQRERASTLKRGGGVAEVSLDESSEMPEALELAPDQEFDRQWALHVIRVALRRLEVDWGYSISFAAMRPFLSAESGHGDLSALAKVHGVKEGTLRAQLHRARKSMRRHIRDQIAETLPSANQLEDEMKALMAALADG